MDIRKKVERICSQYQSRDPLQICRERGILLCYEPLGSVRGYYSCSYRFQVIHLNQELDEARQRFTCGHELGHALLHPKANTPFLRANTLLSVDRLEVEANRFAVCLLYPQDYFRREFEGCSLPQIAESLQLPSELVAYAMGVEPERERSREFTR